jgi:hypothetical protein
LKRPKAQQKTKRFTQPHLKLKYLTLPAAAAIFKYCYKELRKLEQKIFKAMAVWHLAILVWVIFIRD